MQAPASLVSSGGSTAELEAAAEVEAAELRVEVEEGAIWSSRSKSKSSENSSSISIGTGPGEAMAAENIFEAAGSELTAAMSTANLTEAAKSKSTKAGLAEAVAPDLVKATRADLDFLDLDFLDLEADFVADLVADLLADLKADFEADFEADLAKLVEAIWVAMVER